MKMMIKLLTSCDEVEVCFFDKTDTPDLQSCMWVEQVHGNRTIRIDDSMAHLQKINSPTVALAEADGMATDVPDVTLKIRVADCQSFALYAPEQRVISALHAGWRGLIAGAIEEHFFLLRQAWGIDPKEVWVAAGPSLCRHCAEFTDPVAELTGIDARFFEGRNVNLQGIADDKLIQLGVCKERIERHLDCTRCKMDMYWSYRAEPKNVRSGHHNALVCRLIDK